MSTVTRNAWNRYLVKLRNLSSKASDELIKFIQSGHDPYADPSVTKEVIDYAYALATKYGEGAGSLASEMYDALAELSGKVVPPAVPAQTATYGEVAKAVHGTKLQSSDPNVMAGAVGRMVKLAGVDTMQKNALRDGAEWAWIPSGDTCAFCLTLASRGWQRASKKAIKNGHAEHVHANCDCTYAIRFSSDVDVEGYDPETLKSMYDEAEGATPNDKINYLRRRFYAENKGLVGAESSKAEEFIPEPSRIRLNLEADKVTYNPPRRFETPINEEQIISRLGGGDETRGSCASVALAYIGNKGGYDVLDFRGGTSQFHFAKTGPLAELVESVGGKVVKNTNDFKIVSELIKDMENGKQYLFSAGKHTAIIRKIDKSYEYLELQSATRNGFQKLNNDILKTRFGCRKSHSLGGDKVEVRGAIADIDLLKDNPELKELLGYLNTAPGSQQKGVSGYAK